MLCSCTERSKIEDTYTKSAILQKGIEATTNQQVALWSENELKVLEGPNWVNANAKIKLQNGAKILILNVGDEYAKVLTLIGIEGYIVKELLNPLTKQYSDSAKYFEPRKLRRINTWVDGMDVNQVNIWDNMSSRNRVVESLLKNTKVAVIKESGEYVKLATVNGNEGWCMKGFIKK